MIRILFTIIAAMLAVAWGLVFWGPDQTSVLCWWFVMFFSLAGVIFTVFSLVLVAIRVIRKKLPETSLFLLRIVSMIAAWPAVWVMAVLHTRRMRKRHNHLSASGCPLTNL
jgi:uncharacterized membrane protein